MLFVYYYSEDSKEFKQTLIKNKITIMALLKQNDTGKDSIDKFLNDFFGDLNMMFSEYPVSKSFSSQHLKGGATANVKNNKFIYSIPLAGCSDDDVDVELDGEQLHINAEYSDDDYSKSFSTKLTIPSDKYKLDELEASMNNGLLKITIPFKKESKEDGPRKIM